MSNILWYNNIPDLFMHIQILEALGLAVQISFMLE